MSEITIWKNPAEHPETLTEVQLPQFPKTLDEASQKLPDGVYTTFRTFNRDQALLLDHHLMRLADSALRVNSPVTVDIDRIRGLLRRVIAGYATDTRIRLTIDLQDQPGDLYIAAEELHLPSDGDYQSGVKARTYPMQRENPRAKQTTFITLAETVRHQLPEGVFEGLLVDEDGQILEGLSSNFFAVKNGQIWTAGKGVLLGITRSLVLAAAARAGVQLIAQAAAVEEIPSFEECFLSSSSRSVVPVVQVDAQVIGTGRPGPVTQKIMAPFWQEVQDRLEPI